LTPATPPAVPAPQASRKRILPAFLLCFTICAHRIYAGKYISGFVQMGLAAAAMVWTYPSMKGLLATYKSLFAMLNSGSLDDNTLEQIDKLQQAGGGYSGLPMLALIVIGLWIAWDAGRLLAGKFTDRQGNKITRWI